MWTGKTGNMLGALALTVTDRIRAEVNVSLDAGGETAAALVLLGANPALTVAEIAEALGLTHSGAVRLVDRLCVSGLAERQSGPDARAVHVRLTSAGARQRRRALLRRQAVLDHALQALSPSEEAAFAQMLDKLLRRMLEFPDQGHRFCRLCDEDLCVPHGCPVEERLVELLERQARETGL